MKKAARVIKETDNARIVKISGGGVGAALIAIYNAIAGTPLTGDDVWDKVLAILSILYSILELIFEWRKRKKEK